MTEEKQEFISREESGGDLALADDILPGHLHVLPVNGRPFFPAQVQPIIISAEVWGETLKRVAKTEHKLLGVAFVQDKNPDDVPELDDIPLIGCVVRVHHVQVEDGRVQFIAQGVPPLPGTGMGEP